MEIMENMGTTKKIYYGLAIGYVGLIVTTIFNFVINRYFLVYIGLESLGLFKLFNQMVSYLLLAEMGLGVASTYALYKPLADKDYDRVSLVMKTMIVLYNRLMLFILIVGSLLTFTIPYIIKNINIDYKIISYWILYVSFTSVSYINIKYRVLFIADQKINFTKLITYIGRIVVQTVKLIVIIYFKSLYLFILSNFLETIIIYISYKFYYNKNYFFQEKLKNIKKIDKSILKDIKNLLWHKFASVVLKNTDLIIISMFVSLKSVGIYASYLMIFNIFYRILGEINSVITPILGKYASFNSKDKIYEKYKQINILYLMFTIIIFVTTYYLIQDFIMMWLNIKFENKWIILFLCFNVGINSYKSCNWIFKEVNGFFDDIYSPILESVINLIFSLIMVKYLGVLGVVIGTFIAQVIIGLIYSPILVYKRCYDKNYITYIKDLSLYVIYLFVVVISTNAIIKNFNIKFTNIYGFIISGFKVFSVVLLTTFVVFLLDKNFRQNIKIKN